MLRYLSAPTDIFTFADAVMAVVMGASGVTAQDNSGDPRSVSNYAASPQSHKRLCAECRQRVDKGMPMHAVCVDATAVGGGEGVVDGMMAMTFSSVLINIKTFTIHAPQDDTVLQ